MLRGISLEDVLFPRCVPGAERELRGFQSGRRVLRRRRCLGVRLAIARLHYGAESQGSLPLCQQKRGG